MIVQGRECVKCGSDQWNYPDCPPDRSRVKVTCVGCGKYIAHFDYDWKINKTKAQQTSAPEDYEATGGRRGRSASADQLNIEWGDE